MSNGQMTLDQARAELFGRTGSAALEALGIVRQPGKKYRLRTLYDTQDIAAAAAASTEFFNTATSSRALHANLHHGCNLAEPGKVDHATESVLLGYGLQLQTIGGDANKATDIFNFLNYGMLEELWVQDRLVDRWRFAHEMGMGQVGEPVLTNQLATGVGFGAVKIAAGTLGFPGKALEPYERQWMGGGQAIKAKLAYRRAGAALNAALTVRFHLVVVEITDL